VIFKVNEGGVTFFESADHALERGLAAQTQ